MKTTGQPITAIDLPQGLLPSDIELPKLRYAKKSYRVLNPGEQLEHSVGDGGRLRLYYVESIGWCITTLYISKSASAAYPDRYYAIRLSNGSTVRVGGGPHVKSVITIYLRKSRLTALKQFIDLYQSGMGKAGLVRDRVSSRRAEGALMRAEGRSWWRWSI